MKDYSFDKSMELFERASRVVPGGIYGHQTPALLVPSSYPYFALSGDGCRYRDVDGNEFIDYMLGYGPMVLGYNRPEVERAVEEEARRGVCFNHPGEVFVTLAERLVSMTRQASWVVFAKNGSDLTTWALQVAREHTGRKKIVMVKGAYHGTHAWCSPGHGGIMEEERRHIHTMRWGRPDELEEIVKRYRGEVAGVIMTPYHHPAFFDSLLPPRGYWQEIQRIVRSQGILLISDDVRACFRIHMGGSHEYFGYDPDLMIFSKAMANGHPISACLGRKELRSAAGRVFLTGSYWTSPPAMAASLTTIKILEEGKGIQKMGEAGGRLMEGLSSLANKEGLDVTLSGPPALPFMTFKEERGMEMMQVFCAFCARRGVFFHPHHNWFLSTAHEVEDIDETLNIAADGFREVKARF